MPPVQYIQECVCGAMTVTFENGASNSMSREVFDRIGFTGRTSAAGLLQLQSLRQSLGHRSLQMRFRTTRRRM